MARPGTVDRVRENVTGIVSVVVTGVWLAAMAAGFEYWLALMLFGYVVVVPVVAMLFDEEDDAESSTDGDRTGRTQRADERREDSPRHDARREDDDPALVTLRERYARGELTEAQFERKIERLLETDTLENTEEQYGDRERDRLTESG